MRTVSILAAIACGVWGMGIAVIPATAQQVPIKGYFIGQKPCEATRKKDRDNPGNVRIRPRRAYRLLGRNATPGTHYQIVVPGARGTERRWVAMECGAYSAGKPGDGGSAGGTGEPAKAGEPADRRPDIVAPTVDRPALPPGLKADSLEHVLAASWQPGFCRVQPDRGECRTLTAGRFDASHFSLHGLWPDDLDDRAIFPCYCNSGRARSCALKLGRAKRVDLSDAIRAQLRVAMPGMRSGLHLHEWEKHGTCYERDRTDADHGARPDEYFDETLGLLKQLNRSPVRALFAGAIGNSLSASRIEQAFDTAFGPGAGARVIVRCSTVAGREIITELWISLGAGITPDSRLADLIRAAPPAAHSSSARRCREGLVAGAAP